MNRKFIFLIIFSIIIFFIFYKIISFIDLNTTISSLKKYKLKKDEKVITHFKYNNYNYAITSYSTNLSAHNNNHILLKLKKQVLFIGYYQKM